jgi:hypothetical protein
VQLLGNSARPARYTTEAKFNVVLPLSV